MMNAMAEQHFDLTNGRDPRFNPEQTGPNLINPTLAYAMAAHPLDHTISNGFRPGADTTPQLSNLPQMVFSAQPGNYNTSVPPFAHRNVLYNPTQTSPLEYQATSNSLNQYPRSNTQFQDSFHINTSVMNDHSRDALSVESHTPQSMQSKHSFSSFSDLRFPEQSNNVTPLTDQLHTSSSFVSRSPYEVNGSWLDNKAMSGFDQHLKGTDRTHLHSHVHQQQQQQQQQQQHQLQPRAHAHMMPNYRTGTNDMGSSELTDQQVKNLLMITNTTSSSTGKRKPRDPQDGVNKLHDNFICKHCGKTFAKGYNLKSHLKTHSDDRPFQCSFCDRSFARNHDKKRHELLHQGVKKFQCGGVLKDKVTRWGCGKRFSRADGLGRHFRTDIGWLCIRPLMLEAKEKERLEDENAQETIDEATFGTSFINELLRKAQ